MAEFILKDRYGKEKTFDHDKIFVQGTDGELVQFTEGTGDTPAVVQPLEVTENGTYTAPDGVDGFNEVTVNVDPTKITIFKEKEMVGFALDNQLGYIKEEYPPSFTPTVGEKYSVAWDGVVYDNLAVTDASAVVSGAVYIGNGSAYGLPGNNEPFAILYMYGALGYCAFDDSSESHRIGVWKKVVQEISLQDKTITENGTYTADSGYDGLGSVTVEVAGSGGGSLPAGVYWEQIQVKPKYFNRNVHFALNGEEYAAMRTESSGFKYEVYKLVNGVYEYVTEANEPELSKQTEYHGKIHFRDYQHWVFDGTSLHSMTYPARPCKSLFVFNDKLCELSSGYIYEWDEATDTWSKTSLTTTSLSAEFLFAFNGDVYYISSKNLYRLVNGSGVLVKTFDFVPYSIQKPIINNGMLYFAKSSSGVIEIYRYDIDNDISALVGFTPSVPSTDWYTNNGKIRIAGGNSDQATNLIMHEITE